MKEKPLSVGSLSLTNLTNKPVRTVCLVIVVAILAFILFGGSILASSLQNGMDVMKRRFGADLMVVPAGYQAKTEAILLRGEINYFYFNDSVIRDIAQIEGVVQVSPQFFLTSLSSECCDEPVQLIAFDPATDFVIQPWIAELPSDSRDSRDSIGDGQLIIGSEIMANHHNAIKFFNYNYPVAAQLSKTAMGFDTSIFMTMNTMRLMMDNAHKEHLTFIADNEGEGAISAVLVRLDNGYDAETVALDIKKSINGVDVIVSHRMFAHIAEALNGLVGYIGTFSVVLWFVAIVVLAAVFSGSINERKKEFAILRVLGATRKKLAYIVLTESCLAGIFGGTIGIILASLIVFPFSPYISYRLGLPLIRPHMGNILFLLLSSLVFAFAAGPLSAVYSAVKISGTETYFTLREGE
ncbi:ABC transporter permease [Treponema primitia]|uniref:ABC transporter permease n=1 Tax=Treponema primitia TaxID=88058 RepID=UPI0002555822|nr:ABC transporter permease [Treponema primitia]